VERHAIHILPTETGLSAVIREILKKNGIILKILYNLIGAYFSLSMLKTAPKQQQRKSISSQIGKTYTK
jgi:hypothetical protein